MKLFATILLTSVAAASLFAASIPRCDITGTDKSGKIELTPGSCENGVRTIIQNWGDETTRPYRLTTAGIKPVSTEWSSCKLVFTPQKSGTVILALCGQSAKRVEDRNWLTVSRLTINGKPVSNSDLKQVFERKGQKIPTGYNVARNPVYLADGGPDGAAGMTVNHDNRLYRAIQVEAGKPVTVEFMAKAAQAPAK